MKERTLILLKPDAVQRAIIGELLQRFEKTGLKIIGLKMVQATDAIAGEHYANDEAWLLSVGEKTKKSYESKGLKLDKTPHELGQNVRQMLIAFLKSSPTVAVCLEGHGAIEKIRSVIGSTAPIAATPGTIRGDYSLDSYQLADTKRRAITNLVHASDSKDNAEREIKIWFKSDELCPYERVDEFLLYG
ncbi:nucleoside-diphosphate kinase [Candidatus Woesearchaeota archaeon]|nr:nucleoside-diphosphate kinase [Candidatus Woesearchaeota archaeon]